MTGIDELVTVSISSSDHEAVTVGLGRGSAYQDGKGSEASIRSTPRSQCLSSEDGGFACHSNFDSSDSVERRIVIWEDAHDATSIRSTPRSRCVQGDETSACLSADSHSPDIYEGPATWKDDASIRSTPRRRQEIDDPVNGDWRRID
ncbi:hypothetical protein K435DRAFT_878396 [Dendrothele bispora CBS 962.96]|uniref:Uncharacterized protein n=1 Tax=Dendrothele bispora (strain CBS 962.96) TaxID=1314807 RepID=A0A4S8KND6_DENBC|nr:hypothetical protein K435DRAFT_878396 [Dendrothele bispora CBS 962.96]